MSYVLCPRHFVLLIILNVTDPERNTWKSLYQLLCLILYDCRRFLTLFSDNYDRIF